MAKIKIQRRRINHQSRLTARRLDCTTLARALVLVMVLTSVDIHKIDIIILVGILRREREIGLSFGASELSSGGVVGPGGFFGGVKGTEPNAALLAWVPDLGGVPAPWPLPYSPEMHLLHVTVKFNGGGGGRLVPRRHSYKFLINKR